MDSATIYSVHIDFIIITLIFHICARSNTNTFRFILFFLFILRWHDDYFESWRTQFNVIQLTQCTVLQHLHIQKKNNKNLTSFSEILITSSNMAKSGRFSVFHVHGTKTFKEFNGTWWCVTLQLSGYYNAIWRWNWNNINYKTVIAAIFSFRRLEKVNTTTSEFALWSFGCVFFPFWCWWQLFQLLSLYIGRESVWEKRKRLTKKNGFKRLHRDFTSAELVAVTLSSFFFFFYRKWLTNGLPPAPAFHFGSEWILSSCIRWIFLINRKIATCGIFWHTRKNDRSQ